MELSKSWGLGVANSKKPLLTEKRQFLVLSNKS